MKHFLLIVLLSILPASEILAEPSLKLELTRELINDFLQASQNIAKLRRELPDMQAFSDEQAVKTTDQIIRHLEASQAFPEIQSILASTKFATLAEFFEFSERLMAVRLYLQLENSTQATVFQTIEILQANLNSMKANKASKEIIQRAELVLQQQQQKADLIKASLEKMTEQDKMFAKQNQPWLIELFSR